jgi:RNA recognition motif-containing protein
LNVAWAETRHSKDPDPVELEKVKTLYVSNLSVTVNEQVLQALFQEYGQVVNCVIVRNQQKQSRGFAFVEFAVRVSIVTMILIIKGARKCGCRANCVK